VRLCFFASLSIILLVLDLRLKTLEWVRHSVATAAWPLQRIAYLPIDAGETVAGFFTTVKRVQFENDELRKRQLTHSHILLRQNHLEDENRRLRALLAMRDRLPLEGRVADILYSARDPFSRRVIIDKGSQHGIAAGQAVVDDIGVIGQVTRVFLLTSEVSLLTDKDQGISVQAERNGLRAILAGSGAGTMELKYLAANAEVQPGDVLLTSGLDGLYWPGLPVARVTQIDRDNSFAFARITCEPLAGVERHGLVLVLGNRLNLPPPPEEVQAAGDTASRGRRVKRKPH
jgi:rod shape-determining protein MreC